LYLLLINKKWFANWDGGDFDDENNDIVVNEMGALLVCVQVAYVVLCNITNRHAVRPTEIIDTIA